MQKGSSKLPTSRKRQQLQQWLDQELPHRFLGRMLVVDYEVAIRWGTLSGRAEQQGRPLPVLDGLLAATALVARCTLVTRNTPHVEAAGVLLFDPWSS